MNVSRDSRVKKFRYLPAASWLTNYRADWLGSDVVAGVTLAAYAIPVSLAYASLAGLPPQVGIYGYLLGGIGYALLGSSRQLAIGPTSAISLMVAGSVGLMAEGDAQRYAQIASLAAFTVALLCVVSWALRLSALVKLIIDGDITTGISAGVQGTGDHVTVGKGGATEGVITAAAMKCLGGEIQARMWPQNDVQVAKCHDRGIDDVDKKLLTDDLVNGPLIFAATGVTSGNLLKGIMYFKGGARTSSIIMCSSCNHVRFVETIHLFTRERSSEIRL
jgi:hypothetical protein